MEPLGGRACAALRDLIHEAEDRERGARTHARKDARRRGWSLPTGSSFLFFEDVMKMIQARDGDGDADWVLRDV